jgi:predicted hydrocarbon binding protein
MNESSPAPREETNGREPAQESRDGFRADIPLAILESVRQHDRPAEVLEDEDLSISLPRRLGLTGVVDSQIHRYREAQKRRERVSAEQVADLLRLVLRRPDSEPILREAGYAIARHNIGKPIYRIAAVGRFLPAGLRMRLAQRSLRRLLRRIGGGAPVRITRAPFRVEMDGPVTARVDRWAIACILYSAAIEHAIHHTTGKTPHVEHESCEARGDSACAWTVGEPPTQAD